MRTIRWSNPLSTSYVHLETMENTAEQSEELDKVRHQPQICMVYGVLWAHIARVCQGGAMNVAFTKERLTRFGLVSMADYYTERCVTC